MNEENWNYLTKRRGDSGDLLTGYKLLMVITGQMKLDCSLWPERLELGREWEE